MNGIEYNGLSKDRFSSGSSSDEDMFYDAGHTIKESISKITILANAREEQMLQRLDRDYKAFAKGIQSALNDTSYFRQGVKAVDPASGRSYIEYYVQSSEVQNAFEALRQINSRLVGTSYELRPPQQMDYISGTRTFEGKQAQAKALYEIARKGGKLLPTPTKDNPDLYTYMLPFSKDWAQGVGQEDYLDYIFTDSDALSKLEHDKRASEIEVDRNYAKAKKAEMIKKLSMSQSKEAGSVWEQFEREQALEDDAKLRDNYAQAKQMQLMDSLTASQAKEAGGVWDEFEQEQKRQELSQLKDNYAQAKQLQLMDSLTASQAKEAGSVWDKFEREQKQLELSQLKDNYAQAKQLQLMDSLTASQAKEAGGVWDDFEREEEKKKQRDIEVNYQANKRIKRENAQKEAEERREQEKKDRDRERQEAKDSITSKTKRMFLLGQIASMFTVLLDLTRRILSNGLAMASDAKRTEREARNIGSSYASMLGFNYTDSAYGLPEGTTSSALFAIQKMFGDPANLDTKALDKLSMLMGNSVGDAVRSGLGGKNPEKLIEMIMDSFIKSQQAGVNQFGQQVGKEEARRNLYTLLAEISPEIATLFSRAVEANDFGINKGRINSWQDYLDANRRIQGGLSDTDLRAFSTLGEVVDQVKTKFNNLKNMITQEFLLNLSGVIDRINNANWGKSGAEQLDSRQKIVDRLMERREEITNLRTSESESLATALAEYGATGSLEQILNDVNEAPDFWNTANYSPETIKRIQNNKQAVASFYAKNALAKGIILQYNAYGKTLEAIDEQLMSPDPVYNEFQMSDEGIAMNKDRYAGALTNPEWTSDYFVGVSLTDFWENVVDDKSYFVNQAMLGEMFKRQNPMIVAKFKNAFRNYVDNYASKKGTYEEKAFNNSMEALYKAYKKGGGGLSKEDFASIESNQMLAYIQLLTGKVKDKSKTAQAVYGESSTVSGIYDVDLPVISEYAGKFLTEAGSNAVGALNNTGFTVLPSGASGVFTIKFTADVNGEKIEKEYKDVQLKGRYGAGIEYNSDGSTERVNSGTERMGS